MKKSKKRNRRPLYNEGYRGTIMREMLEYGGSVYKNLHMQEGQYVMYTRKIKQMQNEGIVEVIRHGIKDVAILKEFEKNYENYIDDFPLGTYKIYGEESERRRHNLKSGTSTEKERAFREMETLSFLRNSKILTNIMEKTDIRIKGTVIKEDEVNFYTTKEIGKTLASAQNKESRIREEPDLKNETSTTATPAPKTGNKNASRSIGCVISPGNIYVVYDVGSRMMESKKATEMGMRNKVNMLARERSEKYIEKKGNDVRGIVLANDDHILERIVTYQKPTSSLSSKRKKGEGRSYFHIDFTYDKIYGIPINKTGTQMMELMTSQNWEKEMNETFLKPEEIEDARFSSIVCDGYDGKHYILLYCKPDLVKLKQFTQRANVEEDKEKFRIYCFDWQAPLIARITQGNAEIYKASFSKYYEANKRK